MKADFSPGYAYLLGYQDGKEIGHKHPGRSFNRATDEERNTAYFRGLQEGIKLAQSIGLDMSCQVRWDNPGFDTPPCGGHATHIAVADYSSGEHRNVHVIPLCERHTIHAQKANAAVGTPQGFPQKWDIVPISWL